MVSVSASEFILVTAALVIGIALFGLTEAVFIPQYAFILAEQQARALSSATFISISPPAIGKYGYYYVVYPYIAGFKGNITIFMFEVSSTLAPSVGIVTPTSNSPVFSAYFPNGTKLSTSTIGPIYDTSGHELSSSLLVYEVPSNQPIIINGTLQSNNILVVWIIYNSDGYNFRIAYTYTMG